MLSATDRISVVLVAHNSAAVLAEALGSIPEGVEVIVVDNASKDDSLEIARKAGARCIANKSNLGFCKGSNIGARASKREFVLFLNPDAALKKGALDILLETADRYPDAAMIGPRLLNENGESIWRHKSVLHPLGTDARLPVEPEYACCVPLLTGAALLCRSTAFKDVNGFDENIFLYHDDDDLSLRLTQKGWSLIYEPAAVTHHRFGKSSGTSKELTRFKAKAQSIS